MGRLCGKRFKGRSIAEFNFTELPPLLPQATPPAPHEASGSGRAAASCTAIASRPHATDLTASNIVAAEQPPGQLPTSTAGSGEGVMQRQGAPTFLERPAAATAAAVPDPDARRIPRLEELFKEFPSFPIQVRLFSWRCRAVSSAARLLR